MLETEKRNPKSMRLHEMNASEIVSLMQEENYVAVGAIDAVLPELATAVEEISARLSAGGRLFYVGCGTSGRLGVLDASECPPTFGVSPDLVIGLIAGGDKALRDAVEHVEDDADSGQRDLDAHSLTAVDSVVGISVAGGASYVVGALEYAKSVGAYTVALSSNEDTVISRIADLAIVPLTGAEVLTGSTRLKAGTAHKMILNMLSTAVMVRQGYVYENLMVHVKPLNAKLRQRMIGIVSELLGTDEAASVLLLERWDWDIRRIMEVNPNNSQKHP